MAEPKRTAKTQVDSRLAQMLAVLEARAKLLAFFFGLCFVVEQQVIAIWFPSPTPFQHTVFRITLALAAAGVAGVIPSMIRLKAQPGTALLIHAGGALAVFVMVYLLAPAALKLEKQSALPTIICWSTESGGDSQRDIPAARIARIVYNRWQFSQVRRQGSRRETACLFRLPRR